MNLPARLLDALLATEASTALRALDATGELTSLVP